jgi:hypothetical protein
MGLLDDAIREHLELKRRSGADPAVVEREEHEALAPVYPDDDILQGEDGAGLTRAADVGAPHTDLGPVDDGYGVNPRLADLGGVGQDTAELDMRTVLEEDAYAAGAAHPESPIGDTVASSYTEGSAEEELFEWEQAGVSDNGAVPEEIPGQERLSFE